MQFAQFLVTRLSYELPVVAIKFSLRIAAMCKPLMTSVRIGIILHTSHVNASIERSPIEG